MYIYQTINLLEQGKMKDSLEAAYAGLCLGLLGSFYGLTLLLGKPLNLDFQLLETGLMLVGLAVLFIIHEGIHGIFFKLFQPAGKLRFGYSNGMLYATSPGSRYSRKQWLTIALSPFVGLTSLLLGLLLFGKISALAFVFLATAHGTGCVGDFYFALVSARAPKGLQYEDTAVGFTIWS